MWEWSRSGPAVIVAGALAMAMAMSSPAAAGEGALDTMSVAFDAGLGEAAVRGDLFWREIDGVFGQVGLRVRISASGYLHAVFRAQSLGDVKILTSTWAWEAVHSTLRSYQLMAGVRAGGDRRGRPGMRIYLEGGGGIMETAVRVGGRNDSTTHLALAVQAGLMIPAGTNVALDVGAHAFYKPDWLDDEAGGASIGVSAAVMLTH